MGSNQARVQSQNQATKAKPFYKLTIIPQKQVYYQGEDVSGQIILELNRDYSRPGLLVVSLDGKELFEYVPANSKASSSGLGHTNNGNGQQVHRNSYKFLREREVIAQFNQLHRGKHTFDFTFALSPPAGQATPTTTSRRPPSVNLFQEVKGSGVIDIQVTYKIGIAVYDTSNRVDKIMKQEQIIFIRDMPKKAQRFNFIEMGQSQVASCLGSLGSGGISQLQIKSPQDSYQNDQTLKFLNKIDNTRSNQKISRVQVKLIRYLRLQTGNLQTSSSYDTLLSQTLFKKNYDGISPRTRDRDFNREYELDLEPIFEREREEAQLLSRFTQEPNDLNKLDNLTENLMNSSLTPSSYGRTFMMHYALHVSLKHQSFFSKSTSLEIDLNIDSSDLDYQQRVSKNNNHSSKKLRKQVSSIINRDGP
eukprot:403344306